MRFRNCCSIKGVVLALALSATSAKLSAEGHVWTLPECIHYALLNNPDIKVQELTYKDKEIDYNTEQKGWLPKISGTSTQSFTFGRSLTAENTYANTSTRQTTLSVSGEINLFDGFRRHYGMKMARELMRKEEYLLSQAKLDLSMKVAEAYMQVLLGMESVGINSEQVKIDSLQASRLNYFFRQGKASYVDVSQQQATLHNSIAKLTESLNRLRLDRLTLCQLMNLDYSENISVAKFNEESLGKMMPATPEAIYENALKVYPEIMSQKAAIYSSENKIRALRADYFPQLSLVGGVGTNYYKTNGYENGSLSDQLKNNFSQEIQLQLTVPIFNRFVTRNNIRKATLEKAANEIRLRKSEQELFKSISQVYVRAMNAYSQIESCSKAVESSKDAFKLVTKKYECGKATLVEFDDSKNILQKSLSARIQAVFEYIYQCHLLHLFQHRPIS